jgi:hypothetical protein
VRERKGRERAQEGGGGHEHAGHASKKEKKKLLGHVPARLLGHMHACSPAAATFLDIAVPPSPSALETPPSAPDSAGNPTGQLREGHAHSTGRGGGWGGGVEAVLLNNSWRNSLQFPGRDDVSDVSHGASEVLAGRYATCHSIAALRALCV